MRNETNGDTRLHRYFDGDLSDDEAAEVRRAVESDPALRAKLDGLREVRAVVRESVGADLRAEPVPSDDLWARIEASIDAPAAAAEPTRAATAELPAKRPELRAIDGGAKTAKSAIPAPSPEQRRRRIAGIVIGGLALAAAILLIVLRPGEPAPGSEGTTVAEGGEGTEPTPSPAPELEEPATAAEEVAQTEVLEVDFGENSGAIFSVEGDDGERYAVVWLADVQPKQDPVE